MKNKKHLKHVRTLPCVVCFNNDTVAHHIRTPWSSGMGIKSPDIMTLPLCVSCHAELHQMGENRFWLGLSINQFEEVVKIIINKDSIPF